LKTLYWDIETIPGICAVWNTGKVRYLSYENLIQEPYILTICYKWAGHKRVFALVRDPDNPAAMLEKFKEVMDEADEMVAHYGDGFDVKWFNAECLKHGVEPPDQAKTVDTHAIAKRRFLLNSYALNYIAQLLGVEGKFKTSFEMWKTILLTGNKKTIAEMVAYCRQDVRVLEEVSQRLALYHAPKTHVGVLQGREKWSCARCGSESVKCSKRRVTSRGTEQYQMKCLKCSGYYTVNSKAYWDHRAYTRAVAIWEKAQAKK
jgi:hypothetical protein